MMKKDDLISRAAAVRALASSNGDYLDALERLEKIPAVDAVPVEWLRSVHENWLLTPDEMEFRDWLIERWQKEQEAR